MATKEKTTKKSGKRTGNATRLRKITAEAKRIRKASPNKKWQTAMKEAGKKLKWKL